MRHRGQEEGHMKKIFVLWILWTCFWGAVTQGLYYYKSREMARIREAADIVDATVVETHYTRVRDIATSRNGVGDIRTSHAVPGVYLRKVLIKYKYKNKLFSHQIKSRNPKNDLHDYFYQLEEGDVIKIYVMPNQPDSPYLEPVFNNYNTLRYGWIVMGVIPVLLLAPFLLIAAMMKPALKHIFSKGVLSKGLSIPDKHD